MNKQELTKSLQEIAYNVLLSTPGIPRPPVTHFIKEFEEIVPNTRLILKIWLVYENSKVPDLNTLTHPREIEISDIDMLVLSKLKGRGEEVLEELSFGASFWQLGEEGDIFASHTPLLEEYRDPATGIIPLLQKNGEIPDGLIKTALGSFPQ